MKIAGSVALVTGADRGLGRAFARDLVRRGAARVYGAARNPAAVTEPGVSPIALDITDPERVARVANECGDVSLLVNNAGVMKASPFIGAPGLGAARVWTRGGRGGIAIMLSVTIFFTSPLDPSYSASKAAELSLTNGVRMELSRQGTLVVAVHAGFIDTDMAAGIDAPKISPESVAQQTFDAVEAGDIEVLTDERSKSIKASLSRDHELIY